MAMRSSLASVVRSVLAVVLGYAVIAAGTILTFNVIVGQISVASPPSQLLAGTVGAVFSGLAGGMVAGSVAPRAPVLHALGIWIVLAIDTAAVIAKGSGPVWFDLAGSGILAVTAVIGGALIAWRKAPAPKSQTSV
jgi:hypothetical protein